MMTRLRFPSILACSVATALSLLGSTAGARGETWCGGIEIGSKSVKAVAVPIGDDGAVDLGRLVDTFKLAKVNNVNLGSLKDEKFTDDALENTQAAVEDFYRQMTTTSDSRRPRIAPSNIWVVASSGLLFDGPKNVAALEEAVKSATGGAKSLKVISQKREVTLMMKQVIPGDQWDRSIYVDIGGGNTKFGLLISASPPNVEQAVVPNTKLRGTTGFTNQIKEELKRENKQDDFNRFCSIMLKTRNQLKDEVKAQIDNKPSIDNPGRKRIYLSGGSPYLIACQLDPLAMSRDDQTEVPIPLEALRGFNDSIINDHKVPAPKLDKLTAQERKRAEDLLLRGGDLYSKRESILVASEILLGLSEVLHWKENEKEIYFTKSGLVAWIVGYVVEERAKAKAAEAPGH